MAFRDLFSPPTTEANPQTILRWLSKVLWYKLGRIEEFHYVGSGGGEPAFQNSWVNTVGYQPASFYKDPFGRVHLSGVVQNGTVGAIIFTLPVGYRPEKVEMFGVHSNGAEGRLTVGADGYVILIAGSNAYMSLCGVSFRAE